MVDDYLEHVTINPNCSPCLNIGYLQRFLGDPPQAIILEKDGKDERDKWQLTLPTDPLWPGPEISICINLQSACYFSYVFHQEHMHHIIQ